MGRKNEREGKSESALVDASRRRSCSPANVCFAELHSLHTTCLPLRVEPFTGERDKHLAASLLTLISLSFAFLRPLHGFPGNSPTDKRTLSASSVVFHLDQNIRPLFFTVLSPYHHPVASPAVSNFAGFFTVLFCIIHTTLSSSNLGAVLCFVQTNMYILD